MKFSPTMKFSLVVKKYWVNKEMLGFFLDDSGVLFNTPKGNIILTSFLYKIKLQNRVFIINHDRRKRCNDRKPSV